MSEDDIVFPEPETTQTLIMVDPERLQQIERKAAAYDQLVNDFEWFMEQPPHDKIHFGMIHGRFRDAARIAAGEESLTKEQS